MSRVYLCLCKGRKLGNTKHDWESLVLALGASESLLALIRGLVIYDQILEDQFIWSKALLSCIGSSLVLHICIKERSNFSSALQELLTKLGTYTELRVQDRIRKNALKVTSPCTGPRASRAEQPPFLPATTTLALPGRLRPAWGAPKEVSDG